MLGGSIGTGDAPFLAGGSMGTGDAPFLAGGSMGTGDAPFAIISEPLPCAITTVFKPIAPVSTSMTRTTNTSFLDIRALRGYKNTQRHSIPI